MVVRFQVIGIVALLLHSLSGSCQQFFEKTNQLKEVEVYRVQAPNSLVNFQSQTAFSALAIKSPEPTEFYMDVEGTHILIPKDEDSEGHTYFISLPIPRNSIQLIVPVGIPFDLFAIQSGQAPTIRLPGGREELASDCADPIDYVPQSTWRDGLPAPNYTRSYHTVFHNVVHHSAGSNTNTNYTQVVRDIYLFHTQVNGWSDIGYNYLISQDGTIYAGRDPGNGDQDMVRGAHFCGANSGTLGVCLLGNFETATPTNEAWISLESLLTFQLINQGLDPFDSYSHSLGTLGTIVGHREGCATLCPGENVFSQLQNLKASLSSNIQSCDPQEQLSFEADSLVGVREIVTYQNTSEGYENYRWILEGAFPQLVSSENAQTSYSVPGSYDVMLIGDIGANSDTLMVHDFIRVSLLSSEPTVFPNPATSQAQIVVDFRKSIDRVEMVNLDGKLLATWERDFDEIQLPNVESGIYLLNVTSQQDHYTCKLILN